MSALFSENVDALKLDLNEARRTIHNLEQNARRLSDLLAAEKEKTEDQESKIVRLNEDLTLAVKTVGELRRDSERMALLEANASDAASKLHDADKMVVSLSKTLEAAVTELKNMTSAYETLKAENGVLAGKIAPQANLIEAMKARQNAERVISESLLTL